MAAKILERARPGLMALAVLTLVLTALPGGWVSAADNTDPAAAQRRLELARHYLVVSHQAEQMIRSYPEIVRQSKSSCKTAACSNALAAAVRRATTDAAPAYFEAIARIWADTFTEKELTDAVAFVESPSGQAMIAKAPLMVPAQAALSARFQEEVWTRAGPYFCQAEPSECQVVATDSHAKS